MKHYVNAEIPKLSKSNSPSTGSLLPILPPPKPPVVKSTSDAESQTEESRVPTPRSSISPPKSSFSQLATEVEILTAKCEELEAARDAAFDDVSISYLSTLRNLISYIFS